MTSPQQRLPPRSPSSPAFAIDRYNIRKRLGSGSMGTVYLAEHRGTGRLVALKVVRPDRLSPGSVARLQREFQAIASLEHPRLAAAYDFGYVEPGGIPYYTREYIQGEPLAPGPPPAGAKPSEFLRPILDLLEALECLHAQGLLHLDIHPGNLIVSATPERGSILIDFRLFCPPESAGSSLTAHASGLPPELLGVGAPSPATDIFLAGRLLLYRLTGESGARPSLPREISGWGERLTLDLDRIAARALDRDPRRRFQSVVELRRTLEHVLGARRETFVEPVPAGRHLLGRERELARIDQVLLAARSGRAMSLSIVGPHGLGKTRLLEEARMRAQIQGLTTVSCRFVVDPGADFQLGRELETARAGRAMGFAWLDALHAEHGGTLDERLARAARACMQEEGAKPLVLLLDDVELADRHSRLLAEVFLRELRHWEHGCPPARGAAVIAASARPALEPLARGRTLALPPLRREDARRLLATLMQPVAVPSQLAAEATMRAAGSPFRLRAIARALQRSLEADGVLPSPRELPELLTLAHGDWAAAVAGLTPKERETLETLRLLRWPCSGADVGAVLQVEPRVLLRRLARLEEEELVRTVQRDGRRLYQAVDAMPGKAPDAMASSRHERRLHARMASRLAARPHPRPRDLEDLARHLLLAGRKAAGSRAARRAAAVLRERGLLARAAALLEEAIVGERKTSRRFALAAEASDLLAEVGDHERGIQLLEPFLRAGSPRLSSADAVGIRRRLGVHYHRLGRVDKAARAFKEAQELAGPARDVEDLIFIDSELAELHTLRGRLDAADEACQRGLVRLQSLTARDPFRARMEMVLRASRGHLELRRLNLPFARRELRGALRLAARLGVPGVEATILNNLGITENKLQRLDEARRCFLRAEKLLERAGERRSMVSISCNLALIAAKQGEHEEAQTHLERARRGLRHAPGERLEFFAAYTAATVAGQRGDAAAVLETLPAAIKLGRRIGDVHLTRFGEVLLAEARMACGRYAQARQRLRSLATESVGSSSVLARQVQARVLALAALLGLRREGEDARRALAALPRSPVEVLEAWNDLFIGLAELLEGGSSEAAFAAAGRAFRRLRLSAGEALARAGLLAQALHGGERVAMEEARTGLEAMANVDHRLLAVLRPLLLAEADLCLGDAGRAVERLAEASGAIIGSPFLELDAGIEALKARLAFLEKDLVEARAHVHRSLHAREVLVDLLPGGLRAGLLGHRRFAGLEELAARLERPPPSAVGTDRLRATGSFEGMVGGSRAMLGVFRAMNRLRDQEVPILIRGETGTGKELAARAVHRLSRRARGPFFVLHAGSLPAELFESEIFGHVRGAFTGAEEDRAGLLESLAGGTLLLDQVDELAPALQAKLLRVLDTNKVRRLGGTGEVPVDVRFLASTSVDLSARVSDGRFRADLFYRLRAGEILLPPLRDRKDDLPALARHFLREHARRLERPVLALRPAALHVLERHRWPGNVRELEGALLRALTLLSPGAELGAEELEAALAAQEEAPAASPSAGAIGEHIVAGRSLVELRTELDRAYLLHQFHRSRGDLRAMMEVLGVKQAYLYRWLRKVGLNVRELRRRGGSFYHE